MPNPIIDMVQSGANGKFDPFTICIIANPVLESPWESGKFVPDSIILNPARFNAAVKYIVDCLLGRLPEQAERMLADPTIGPNLRIVSLFERSLPPQSQNALVGEHSRSDVLVPRRTVFQPFLAARGISIVDVAYAVSDSAEHVRSSAFATTDDDNGPGTPFMLDGKILSHRHRNLICGTIALHSTSDSLVALHEFSHAVSSFTNGHVTDLYVDSPPDLNCKTGRPIPSLFSTYNTIAISSDLKRDGLGYPPTWSSYHCQLVNPDIPAVMDNFLPTSQHDIITRQFVVDRVLAKIGR